jgi:hypothetical protein
MTSSRIGVHLVRGIAGGALFLIAVPLAATHAVAAVALGLAALALLGGCPLCWTLKLARLVTRPLARP